MGALSRGDRFLAWGVLAAGVLSPNLVWLVLWLVQRANGSPTVPMLFYFGHGAQFWVTLYVAIPFALLAVVALPVLAGRMSGLQHLSPGERRGVILTPFALMLAGCLVSFSWALQTQADARVFLLALPFAMGLFTVTMVGLVLGLLGASTVSWARRRRVRARAGAGPA